MALQTTVEQVDARVPVTVVALEGELDASNYERLVDEVRGLYEAGSRQLVLDLSGLTFMASSGLVALHSIVQVMHGEEPPDPEMGWAAFHAMGNAVDGNGAQTEVRLCGAQPSVERVLGRTGLDRLFVVHPDRASAIAAV
jgi:anti-anti-sigma factor